MSLFDKLTVVLRINEPATPAQKKISFIWGSINFIYRINFIRSHFTFLMNLYTRRTCSSAHCIVHCALALLMWSVINNLCYTIFYVYLNSCSFRIWFGSHYYLCFNWCDAVIDDASLPARTHTHLATVLVCSACIHLRNSFDVKRHGKIMTMCTCQRQVFPSRVK